MRARVSDDLAATAAAELGEVPRWLSGDASRGRRLEVAGDEPWSDLGSAYERALRAADRRRSGSHFTPAWLAAGLVERTVETAGDTVLDPACGGGEFLVRAAERLVRLGASPAAALGQVVGFDTDPGAVEVAAVALWWWGRARGVDADRPDVRRGDGLLDPLPRVEVVVGNPPFLGQLTSATARSSNRRERIGERLDLDAGPYVDEAALFLVAAVDAVVDGGRVALVQPRSMLSARDAATCRARVLARAAIESIWLDDDDRTFDAAVRVCAISLRRAAVGQAAPGPVRVVAGRSFDPIDSIEAESLTSASWATALRAEAGLPMVELAGPGRVGDRAEVLAGFRDEYYGLLEAVREDSAGEGRPLVTSGAIDLSHLRWGDVATRFGRRRWVRPVVDPDLATVRARVWLDRQARPKILVANQTPTLEAVVDETGDLVGSVPVVAVVPRVADDLWRVAAVLSAPATTSHLLAAAAGAARSVGSLRVSAEALRTIPWPQHDADLDAAAEALRSAHRRADPLARRRDLEQFAAHMALVQGVGEAVGRWWLERVQVR